MARSLVDGRRGRALSGATRTEVGPTAAGWGRLSGSSRTPGPREPPPGSPLPPLKRQGRAHCSRRPRGPNLYPVAAVPSASPSNASRLLEPSLNWLLVLVPVSLLIHLALHQDLLTFLTAAGAIVPLAGIIGSATEQLSIHAGPRVGGLLNATFGNVTELIISLFLVLDGELEVVKASLT